MSARGTGGHAALVVACAALLVGCPSTWGFWVRVSTLSGRGALAGTVLGVVDHGVSYGEPVSSALTPVPGAVVTCDGCDGVHTGADGRFGVSLGTHYAARRAVTLHVRAPGYAPIDVRVPEPPHDSEAGFATMIVVLERAAP